MFFCCRLSLSWTNHAIFMKIFMLFLFGSCCCFAENCTFIVFLSCDFHVNVLKLSTGENIDFSHFFHLNVTTRIHSETWPKFKKVNFLFFISSSSLNNEIYCSKAEERWEKRKGKYFCCVYLFISVKFSSYKSWINLISLFSCFLVCWKMEKKWGSWKFFTSTLTIYLLCYYVMREQQISPLDKKISQWKQQENDIK